MSVRTIRRGLDLPARGAPRQEIDPTTATPTHVAVVADDYPFMKPRMLCAAGDVVKRGQPLFEDRKTEGVHYTAPAAGRITAVNRGERRALQTVVIELSDGERAGNPTPEELQSFTAWPGGSTEGLDGAAVRALLVESGLWTALRQRPFSKVPSPESSCRALFVTAIDTNPLSANPEVVLAGRQDAFVAGLRLLTTLSDGPVYLCTAPGASIPGADIPGVQREEFAGKHPAGLPGTHMHFLAPASAHRVNWYIGYQDVADVGELFATGRLPVDRVVALGGPVVRDPRLLRTRVGAAVDALVEGELAEGENRVVSGSPLYGRAAMGPIHGYLGRFANQVSALAEGRDRVFLNWMRPGFGVFSTIRAFAGSLFGGNERALTTSTYGSHRAMVPIGMFERVMPLDILPTFLLRALLVDDVERAEALGCLELDEEDLALCTFVSPGKEDYGPALRRNLLSLWKEG